MRVTVPNKKAHQQNVRRKIFLQLGLFVVFAGIAWNYLESRSSEPNKSIKNFPELSDQDLLRVAESMYLSPTRPSVDKKTEELAKFGHDLFFDEGFSANGKVSCATCHRPDLSFTDGRVRSEGISQTAKNAPTLVNLKSAHWLFWNGRADSLESQATGPVEHPGEQGFSRIKVAYRLKSHYSKKYEKIFGSLPKTLPHEDALSPAKTAPLVSDEIAAYALATLGNSDFQKSVLTSARDQGVQPIEIIKNHAAFSKDQRGNAIQPQTAQSLTLKEQAEIDKIFANFVRAIAAFERTIVAAESPFDKFTEAFTKNKSSEKSLHDAFASSELNGLRIFAGKGQCLVCHSGPKLTDEQFHNIGLPATDAKTIDLGRAQGLLIARSDPFNCTSQFFPEKKQTESCLELGYLESENVDSVGAFKTPTLRQLKDSAPYGHDGRFSKLEEVLQHYNELKSSAAVGREEATLRPLGLTRGELKDLEAFLLSLQGKVTHLKR
jgi:cytochrome c peroxidase